MDNPLELIRPELREVAAVLNEDPEDRQGWDMAVSLCQEAVTDIDNNQFLVGDAAALLAPKYGENTLARFAQEIGKPAKTVDEWKRVASFWNFPRRRKFQGYPLHYTHFRAAMVLGDEADAFLEECLNNGWDAARAAVEAAKRTGKTVSPRRLASVLAVIAGTNPDEGLLVLRLEKGADWWGLEEAQRERKQIKVTMKEVEQGRQA